MLQLTALNDSEVETIHQGTLRILAETGVIMKHPRGLEILTGEGAQHARRPAAHAARFGRADAEALPGAGDSARAGRRQQGARRR